MNFALLTLFLSVVQIDQAYSNPVPHQQRESSINCWYTCGRKAGACYHQTGCGKNGYCCRKGWIGDPEVCQDNANKILCSGHHCCVYPDVKAPTLATKAERSTCKCGSLTDSNGRLVDTCGDHANDGFDWCYLEGGLNIKPACKDKATLSTDGDKYWSKEPCKQAGYEKLPENKQCSEGTFISNIDQCATAAAYLKITATPRAITNGGAPKGCFQMHAQILFNKHATGSMRAVHAHISICIKKMPEKSTKAPTQAQTKAPTKAPTKAHPEHTTSPPQTTEPYCGFKCHNDSTCIRKSYVCDNYLDCSDGSDEKFCNRTTSSPSPE